MKAVLGLVVLWLMVGSFVAGARNVDSDADACTKTVTIALTALLGPVNYLGVTPRVNCPKSMVERQKATAAGAITPASVRAGG